MSTYQFSDSERYAVFTVHGEKCYLCKKPINLGDMHVDHIIPEHLDKDEKDLEDVLNDFGLDKTFDLNSFQNWLPSCPTCNLSKKGEKFNPAPIILKCLQNAIDKAEKATELRDEIVSQNKLTRSINALKRSSTSEGLSDEIIKELEELLDFHENNRAEEMKGEPIKIYSLIEVLSDKDGIKTIRGPYGIGGRPSDSDAHGSFDCPNCGALGAWQGARCVVCGMLSND